MEEYVEAEEGLSYPEFEKMTDLGRVDKIMQGFDEYFANKMRIKIN